MHKSEQPSKVSQIILQIGLVMVAFGFVAMLVLYIVCGIMFRPTYDPDYFILSPDGQYELVICEWSFGMGGGADVYIRKAGQEKGDNSSEEQYIGHASTDDGYPAFGEGNYYVEWESDKVTIYYYEDLQVEDVNDPSTWRGVLTYEFE